MAEEGSVGTMRVEVGTTSLTQSSHGAVFGEVFVDLGETQFPERVWNDFIVVVLGWWCAACAAILQGASQQELMFMDGPFLLKVSVAHGEVWIAQFLRLHPVTTRSMAEYRPVPGLPDALRFESSFFLDSLAKCAQSVLAECDHRGWKTPEVEELREALAALRSGRARSGEA